jgi:peptide/nickel transport system permease protein
MTAFSESSPMWSLILRRLGVSVLLILAVSVAIFAGTEMLPGDVAQVILGQSATPDAVANLRHELGLDRPAHVRFLDWAEGAVRGDWGTSLTSGQNVADLLAGRLGNTLLLAATAAAISVPLALLLGLVAAHFRHGWIDRAISITTVTAVSLPEFFVGYVLILVFAVVWPVLPANSIMFSGMPLGDRLAGIALPAATLTIVSLAQMMRMTRAAILNVMSSGYVETAELKGVSPFRIIFRHALPNAAAPIITIVLLNLAALIVGVVIVDVVFVYPGMGQLMVDHVSKRDIPVVQAAGVIFASVYILLNAGADVLAVLANPRLRHPR